MGKQTLQPSTVMTMRERRELAKLQKKDQERRRKEKRDRLNASEFGAATTDAALGRSSTRKSAVRVEKKSLKPTSTYTADTVKKAKKAAVPKTTSRQPKMLVNAENFNKQKDRVVKKPKGDATPVSMPKSRPKRKGTDLPADFTKAKKNNNATNYGLGKMKKDPPKGPGVGKQDKEDKRKNFKSKPVKNAALPAGAKPFKGGYNNKTHKLQNIRGKTYVVPKPKAKKK